MEYSEKAILLYQFLKDLYAQKYPIIKTLKDQVWHVYFSDIPKDEKNIEWNYIDRVDDSVNYSDVSLELEESEVQILSVTKPDFEKCPQAPNSVLDWLKPGWENYINSVELILEKEIPQSKVISDDDSKQSVEKFHDDSNRVSSYEKWLISYNQWRLKQNSIARTRLFFNSLYSIYIDLDRESETYELLVGQGILEAPTDKNILSNHPILLKRVSIKFDPLNNIVTIYDSNQNPEIYSSLLQCIKDINHNVIRTLQNDLNENFYHPLDRNDTLEYLKKFAHSISSDSLYIDDPTDKYLYREKILMTNNPVIFMRKKTGGVIKSLEQIIELISETDYVPAPLLNLLGEAVPQFNDGSDKDEIENHLARNNGEDESILLSKEANREQLEIAHRIKLYNAVLVQGPPGTGKTHTIANLIGHFLSEGKSILVTSHTKKALTVVKDKIVPELQDLCVSILEDNNRDMESSIDGISEHLSKIDSFELKLSADKHQIEREQIIKNLNDTRKNLFSIKNREYESIIYNGKGYTASQAAQFVYENNEVLNGIIPGRISQVPYFPISRDDLEVVYQTNSIISSDEEIELEKELPAPSLLLNPMEFCELIENKRIHLNELESLKLKNPLINYSITPPQIHYNQKKITQYSNDVDLKELLFEIRSSFERNNLSIPWIQAAILAGKLSGGHKAAWETLIKKIEEVSSFTSNSSLMLLGKHIDVSIPIDNKLLKILIDLRRHYQKNKKILFVNLLMNRNWKIVLESIKINGLKISSLEEIESAITFVEQSMNRMELASIWDDLIYKNGGASSKSLGDNIEQAAFSYINQIQSGINWFESDYLKIKSLALKCGFSQDLFADSNLYTDLKEMIQSSISFVYGTLIDLTRAKLILFVKLPEADKQRDKTLDVISDQRLRQSPICNSLLKAIADQDCDSYQIIFAEYERLSSKYLNLRRRIQILVDIEKVAPGWATLIKSRQEIHGRNIVPENLEKAWQWKYFASRLDELSEDRYEELLEREIQLKNQLRKCTAKLAEARAWFHLHERVEKDMSQKQALQGWKLTVKKIGKGTGRSAPRLKHEAMKSMAKCQLAVPAWVMPISKALESLNPATNRFDIVIIDEASQADITALAVMYLGKKIIIVGDDEQVSPSAVGIEENSSVNLANIHIKDAIPNYHLYDMKTSLYDIGKTTFPTLMLKEHFRCVPDIIGYSNILSYNNKILPLRDDSEVPVRPATVLYRVDGQRNRSKTNHVEAETIVALLQACIEQPEYFGMTFGVISMLGEEQAKYIQEMAIERINAKVFEERKILCGNPAHFQGDERDVIFLSMVDYNEGDGPLPLRGEGSGKMYKQRYNVAVSRARNQIWTIYSFDPYNSLKPGDIRRNLIEYMTNPSSLATKFQKVEKASESPFESAVAKNLIALGFSLHQQWKVGSFRIDMVVKSGHKKVAIECDGELYHSGINKVREDMERQAILERLGWRFIRIRGSEYFRAPQTTIDRVVQDLTALDIFPESNSSNGSMSTTVKSDLIANLLLRTEDIKKNWQDPNYVHTVSSEPDKNAIRSNQAPSEVINDLGDHLSESPNVGNKAETSGKAIESTEDKKRSSPQNVPSNIFKFEPKSYGFWEPTVLHDPYTSSIEEISIGLFEIIKAESPIVCNRAYHIYAQACSTKVSINLKGYFNQAMKRLVNKKEIELEDEFNDHQHENKVARLVNSPKVVVRQRGDRTINEIPLSELAVVIKHFSKKNNSLETIFRDVMGFYDLSRLTDNARSYLIKATQFKLYEEQANTSPLSSQGISKDTSSAISDDSTIKIQSNREPDKPLKINIDEQKNQDIAVILKKNGFIVVDNRHQTGGHIWIIFDRNKHELLKSLVNNKYKITLAAGGSKATYHKPAWWLEKL